MTEQRFTLWRQDDNGIRARVADYPTPKAAEQARADYESLGHKQLYWVEENRQRDTE
ncbi:hypothetical protein T9A_01586 [Alcanivorax jadensis T9]|jgi:hypothetical protein|uniref:SPOR domain-containing protein n=1 Tax=Alcanivorax jadensis T9 TaxID=1177181 RepID=A0ABR4WEG3_9GAMM|nr:SPOR domain-containing protein [Alcanivorax jadensis]KGD61637.1 hypothetical protein T9A_01586 [Alcanivorax jadensis T9]MDF1637636.1 hypothetical protein [Alcanivorax jadensis]|tara:strand:+ start:86 stop:256 length:171 start_codon:yes stop_codon:yes gene_type:complete